MKHLNSDPIYDLLTSIAQAIIATLVIIAIVIFVTKAINREPPVKNPPVKKERKQFINVEVYSYQLKEGQTDVDSTVGAFGDTLEMDIGIIALSRDLKYFFDKNDTIHLTIQNKKHTFVFKDIMGPKHRNAVDLLTKENIRGKRQLWLK